MRIVVSTAGILIILAVAWMLYLNYNIKEFDASLPDPVVVSEPQQESPQEIPVVDSKNSPETEVSDDVFESDEATPIEDVSPKMESQENQDTVVIWTDADTESSVDAEIGTLEEPLTLIEETPAEKAVGPCGEICEPSESSVDFHSLSKDEQREHFREVLIKQFGDIPEVHRFIHYMELSQNHQTISVEEALENARAIATLFPNEANKRHVREMELRVASSRTMQR